MSNDDWIKLEDAIPKLNQEVEVKFYDGDIEKAKLITDYNYFCTKSYLCLENPDKGIVNLRKVIGWRPIPEKRPDFRKLKEGDFIVFIFEETGTEGCGYYDNYDSKIFHVSRLKNGYSKDAFEKSMIKKIIRINMEEHKFEEI